tara:strand:+ start:90 stop:1505 length:1416 start_codon:yes stop_codon:yes gene_type:complete
MKNLKLLTYLLTFSTIISCQHDENIVSSSSPSEPIIENNSISLINNRLFLVAYSILITLLLLLTSCQKELDFVDTQNNQPVVVVEKTIDNGRFVFTSKESLKTTIEEFQNENIEKVEKEFEKLYENGFRSHKPMVSSKNELLQAKLSEEIMQKRQLKKSSSLYGKGSGEDNEDDSEFIGDPLLAALVNDNEEIIVNDTIYKFTKEKGLFFAHVKDSTYLLNYFKEESKNTNKSSSLTAKAIPIDLCLERALYGGITTVDNRISRFVAPLVGDCYPGGGGGGGIPPTPVPQLSEEEKLQQIINGLPECYGSKPFFQNILGQTFVCRNYFDDRHRIKTEFWSQDYLFYQSVGVQTKTQTKTLGIWWASDSDEIYLGINRILLKYNFPQPQINSYSHPQLFPSNSYKNPIYMWDGKFKVNVSNSQLFGTFVDIQLKLPSGNLPFFKFEDDQLLNIYIPKLFNKGNYNLNLLIRA